MTYLIAFGIVFTSALFGALFTLRVLRSIWREFVRVAREQQKTPGHCIDLILSGHVTIDLGPFGTWKATPSTPSSPLPDNVVKLFN